MFGKKTKELQKRVALLESTVQHLSQMLEREKTILEFVTSKKKTLNQIPSVDFDLDTQSKLGEVLITSDCAQKIDKLSKLDLATKDDIARIDTRFLEIFNTVSGLFAHLGKSSNEEDIL